MSHSEALEGLDFQLLVGSIAKEVLSEIDRSERTSNSRENRRLSSRRSSSLPREVGEELSEGSRKRKKKKKKKKKGSSNSKETVAKIDEVLHLLEELKTSEPQKKNTRESNIPQTISVHPESARSESLRSLLTSNTVGSADFYKKIATKLAPHRNSICIQEDLETLVKNAEEGKKARSSAKSADGDFQAAFAPEEMRCLALVSHNEMKSTMKEFVECHKQILKKFRLTGTSSTMAMLEEVFRDEPDIVFGPTCSSGPLGGDAELVTLMVTGQLGGILFFQDPMTAHPHQADIDCLNRQAQVHNTIIATTPTTAMALTQVFRMALKGEGKPELLPSFFFSLQGPSVAAYKKEQMVKVSSLASLSRMTVSTTGTGSK